MKDILTFDEMYKIVPQEIKELLDKCSNTPQNPECHPEGNVLNHIKIVYERAKKTGDLNLVIIAIFHDLGKVDTTKKNKKGIWTSYGHEFISSEIVTKYKDWITSIGADYNIVKETVENHMRIKFIDNMRPIKQKILRSLKSYKYLLAFSRIDDMKYNDNEIVTI